MQALANTINKALLDTMSRFTPLSRANMPTKSEIETVAVPVDSVFKYLASLNPTKATGPDNIPSWFLKENADLLAPVVTDVLNSSFKECCVPPSWKQATVVPIPKEKPVYESNKHLRPILLTPILSKLVEQLVVDLFVKPAVLRKVDPRQFRTIRDSCTTQALISMLHSWNRSTDGNGATVRVVLLDFRKTFDLIDHHILVQKRQLYDLPAVIVAWITDFLTCRKQRVKLGNDCYSEWGAVPAGVPRVTKLGPWLFLIMINDLNVPDVDLWKYVDDTTISECVPRDQPSSIQSAVDYLARCAAEEKFQLNESKCKELRISFSRGNSDQILPIIINNKPIKSVGSAKILGLHVSCDLKWNVHVDEVI